MKKKYIALLSGGKSSERDVSLTGGDEVFKALDKDKYDVFRYDPKTDIEKLIKDSNKIDLAFILLHGQYGEDGTIQGLLDLLEIPYQGTGVLGSSIAINKVVSKQLYEKCGLPVPPYCLISKNHFFDIDIIVDSLGLPIVVKPSMGGSSIGMSLVRSKDLLKKAIEEAFIYDDSVLIEVYIKGIELTSGIIGNKELEALPLVEIIPDTKYDFFNYEAKYTSGATKEICPARIDDSLSEKVKNYGKMAHKALFCKGYSRTDIILDDNKDIYILETNTIPGMTPTSLLPLAAKTYGISFAKLLDKLIELGLEK